MGVLSGSTLPLGRYPSTSLQHVKVEGEVLDICGSSLDAVYMVMTAQGLNISTNDMNRCLLADKHYDASSEECLKAFTSGARRVDWIVTSPPHKKGFEILSQALRIAHV